MKSMADRVRLLERRVATLERELRQREAAPEPLPDAPAPETHAPEPSDPPRVEAPFVRSAVAAAGRRRKPAGPPRSLEVDFGRWMSRLGGASLVVAAGFLFAYAAKQGWLTPSMRVVLGLASGAALVAAGEWQHRKLKSFAAALTGAGIGVLFVSVYAGYAFLDFFGDSAALMLATGITAGGVCQALRHDTEAIAGLAAVGGFLAPAIVLDFFAQPMAILAYVLVLNGGLCLLRARKGWISTEAIAWLGTPLVVALPMTQVELGYALGFLLANVALFGVRPRLRKEPYAPPYTLILAAVTAGASFILFEHHETPGWAWFAGGLAAVLFLSAYLGSKRSEEIAAADLVAAAGFAVLAIFDGLAEWEETVALSALAVAILLVPGGRLRETARSAGGLIAFLAVLHVVIWDAWFDEHRLLAFVCAAAAVAAIGTRPALWGAVVLAALGVAAEVATARGAHPWTTLTFLTEQTAHPSTRLLACGTAGALLGLYAYFRRNRRVLFGVGVYLCGLLVAEALYGIEGNGVMPLGLVAAMTLAVLPRGLQTLWAVAVALAAAVAADMLPPDDFIPFLNRRAFAVGGVLAVGWYLLRGRPEGRSSMLMLLLLAAAEFASIPDRAGGALPWRHLYLDLRAPEGIAPFWNARFFFLVGASAVAFLAARRWRAFAVAGHVYAALALGAEAVGLVRPELRSHVWAIFLRPADFMGPHLALTGVILVYGAALTTAGILLKSKLSRRIGLGMLLAGGLKVSVFDLTALGELYRVGSFVVLGATYLAGSYAYNRWVTPESDREAA